MTLIAGIFLHGATLPFCNGQHAREMSTAITLPEGPIDSCRCLSGAACPSGNVQECLPGRLSTLTGGNACRVLHLARGPRFPQPTSPGPPP